MLGQIFIPFFAVVGVLAGVGGVQAWRAKKKAATQKQDGELLPQRAVENIVDLGDRFNRARYMDQDGK